MRVLHLEDSLPDAERIHQALRRAFPSTEVLRVDSGASFREALATTSFDLILASYRASDLSGLQALECGREISPDTPFVFVSHVADSADASAALESLRRGAAEFVVKQELDRLGPSIERALAAAATEQRQRQDANDRRASQEEFISRISHDLRTPLTAIKASIGVILANEPPGTSEPLHRMFRNIDFASDQMAEMVANLAELARLEGGFTQIRETACDLRDVIQRVGRTAEPLAQKRGQLLILDLPDTEVATIVDVARVERALSNLLSNAMKYGDAPGEIRVSLSCDQDAGVISVGDEGPGFPEDEHVFSRNGLAEPSPRTRPSGLGLLIAQAMIELHGGRIWIDRTVAHGATVRCSLPLRSLPGTVGGSAESSHLGHG